MYTTVDPIFVQYLVAGGTAYISCVQYLVAGGTAYINSSKFFRKLKISLLLRTHFPCIWYHWKALLFLFTMMCHLLWLRNLGMCSTPEYGGWV